MADKANTPRPKVEIGGRAPKTADNKGRVRVYLSMTDPETKKPVASNISMALYVNGATVTEVGKAIQKALG